MKSIRTNPSNGAPGVTVAAGKSLTDEMLRILNAVDEGRLFFNKHGRWEIDFEERPDRRSRELLRKRGLIEATYYNGRPGYRITAKGKAAFRAWLDERVRERRNQSAATSGGKP